MLIIFEEFNNSQKLIIMNFLASFYKNNFMQNIDDWILLT